MANLKELRNRIESVNNTRKITAAMSQIAAAQGPGRGHRGQALRRSHA
jgi:hypothetical protein